MLAEDVAHLAPDLLDRAIQRHVAASPYMPKAADLIKLAQSFMMPATTLEAYADELNERNFTKAMGWRWFVGTRKHPDGSEERYLDRKEA